MPESETLVVFRILGVLAKARNLGHALPVEQIADAAHLGRSYAERYMHMLEHARAVQAKATPTRPLTYSLTRYGLERLAGGCARQSGAGPSARFLTPA
jgi:DNA-binding IclR family transcriptional regulator